MPAYHAPQIDHAAYARRVRRQSEAELLFTIADARQAIAAMPDGPKAGYYADEIHYANAELARRARGGRRIRPRPDADTLALEPCSLEDAAEVLELA